MSHLKCGTIARLLAIKKAILAEPNHFNICTWYGHIYRGGVVCGTTACIAGWAIALERKTDLDQCYRSTLGSGLYATAPRGRKILQLSHEQSRNLFHRDFWPIPFKAAHLAASTPTDRAQIAADRIDHFIATGE